MVLAGCGAGRKAASDGMRAIIDELGGAIGWRATGSAFWTKGRQLITIRSDSPSATRSSGTTARAAATADKLAVAIHPRVLAHWK